MKTRRFRSKRKLTRKHRKTRNLRGGNMAFTTIIGRAAGETWKTGLPADIKSALKTKYTGFFAKKGRICDDINLIEKTIERKEREKIGGRKKKRGGGEDDEDEDALPESERLENDIYNLNLILQEIRKLQKNCCSDETEVGGVCHTNKSIEELKALVYTPRRSSPRRSSPTKYNPYVNVSLTRRATLRKSDKFKGNPFAPKKESPFYVNVIPTKKHISLRRWNPFVPEYEIEA